jgi:ferredoxin--NADP+ reductase/benzoate/toluate 1,2-dioxygenase reductase subunit
METLENSQQTYVKGLTHRVQHVRQVSETAYVLRVDRKGLSFESGQYINVGPFGSIAMREYSVYSGTGEDFLEILVKEVEGGVVSQALKRTKPGDPVALEGPFGFFLIDEEQRKNGKFLFIASGTGISPFHSLTKSYPGLDYTLLHGVRTTSELYDHEVFDPTRFVSCVSREEAGDFHGRVTDYLRANPAAPESLCYLCGNCDMIYEAFDILRSQGVPPDHLFAEVYF